MADIIVFIVLVACGYFIGGHRERSHYRSIFAREAATLELTLLSGKAIDPAWQVAQAALVTGVCVISVDYFKSVAAGLRNLVGGRVSAYESLIDRARREALLRMKAQAAALGGKVVVINVRLETSSISGMKADGRSGQVASVEVIAYGTALALA
ncbi:MAG: heavy metal-binding domain-containing protein [Proteobacteria bacterium]|nr:heavy metal-binding domain-containing protein [Pseudomonadota bacterium]